MSNNQKKAFEDGDDAASKSPGHTNPSGNDLDKKVRSLEDSNLRGGNFVLDLEGRATTLSFAFEKDGALYGLTAGNLADIGDPIFVFFLSSKTPNDFNDKESYEIMKVGKVVSKDVDTDSLIFEITHPHMQGKVIPSSCCPGPVLLTALCVFLIPMPVLWLLLQLVPKLLFTVLCAEAKLAVSNTQATKLLVGFPRKVTLESPAQEMGRDHLPLAAIVGPYT